MCGHYTLHCAREGRRGEVVGGQTGLECYLSRQVKERRKAFLLLRTECFLLRTVDSVCFPCLLKGPRDDRERGEEGE